MFSFSNVATQTVNFIQDATALIDPSTLIGGVVTLAIMSTILVAVVRRLRRLAR